MTGPLDDVPVRDNAAAHRYEARVDGHVAIIAYAREGDRITFLHTIVPPALEGHGLASRMARVALEEAREQHLEVIARCPFVASYIRRHPDYLSLVPEEERALAATAGSE